MKRYRFLALAGLLALLAGCGHKKAQDKAAAPPDEPPAPVSTVYSEPRVLPPSHPVIDVWKLRDAVARAEPFVADEITDYCYPEGGGDESARELAEMEKASRACVAKVHARYAAYQRVRKAFNKQWLPVMMAAIRRGDLVAEVIMRQCDTTPLFDRSGIESTCDRDPLRRVAAARRLRAIGFAPAFDLDGEGKGQSSGQLRADGVQQLLLERFRHGMFAMGDGERALAWQDGNGARSPAELEEFRRGAVLESAVEDVPRVFTRGVSGGWEPRSFGSLRLNRKPMTRGDLTWGHRLLYIDGGEVHLTAGHDWRSGPITVYLEYQNNSVGFIAYRGDVVFRRMLRETLAAAEANIARYLAQDKRWSVFLINRVGLDEWVPEGMDTRNGQLGKAWQGDWVLEKVFHDWRPAAVPAGYRARIYAEGKATHIQFGPDGSEPPCDLRYSGGKTFPTRASGRKLATAPTPLGPLSTISGFPEKTAIPVEPFAPFNPKVQYPQVLVQCAQGENLEADRVRFLLLAQDTLIEVIQQPHSRALVMKHYRRAVARQ